MSEKPGASRSINCLLMTPTNHQNTFLVEENSISPYSHTPGVFRWHAIFHLSSVVWYLTNDHTHLLLPSSHDALMFSLCSFSNYKCPPTTNKIYYTYYMSEKRRLSSIEIKKRPNYRSSFIKRLTLPIGEKQPRQKSFLDYEIEKAAHRTCDVHLA